MGLLVLGGTRFVGRAVIAEALDRGWHVTALHRGQTGSTPPDVEFVRADRTDDDAFAAAVGRRHWDCVVDTWSGAPRVVTAAASGLVRRVDRYAYVSSGSVYAWGTHVDETSPLVDGDPNADGGDYAAVKRGAELGIELSFPDAVLARAGLILGPWEDIGRLPWWLRRIASGGRVVAPGRPQRPLQYVDVRDLAGWLLTALDSGISGPVDVIGPSGLATTASLLEACRTATGSDAELVWVDEATLAEAGVEPWTQLPCWVPEQGDFAGFLESDTGRAAAIGLAPRPVLDTVVDTWRWLEQDGPPAQRDDRAVHGLSDELEQRVLELVRERRVPG